MKQRGLIHLYLHEAIYGEGVSNDLLSYAPDPETVDMKAIKIDDSGDFEAWDAHRYYFDPAKDCYRLKPASYYWRS